MISPKEIYLVEYSLAQQCFHVEDLASACETNLDMLMRRRQSDFAPIAAFLNTDDCNKFIDAIRQQIDDYKMFRTSDGRTIVLP